MQLVEQVYIPGQQDVYGPVKEKVNLVNKAQRCVNEHQTQQSTITEPANSAVYDQVVFLLLCVVL